MAADVEPEDLGCPLGRLCGSLRELDAAGLAAPSASFTPPALPRPPVSTCALTTTAPPISSAALRASSGVSASLPFETGMPTRLKSSLP